ncbi:MAG: FAD binding domain-containing protein [Deltaproteobacteria bacterium]|nr:FAD binding domain-containing protein [Deltaproteobacteria bacterium]
MRDSVVLYINGRRHELKGEHAFATLSDYLRYERRLTGTKVVCAEGDCGACTVLVGRAGSDRPWRFEPVNACIVQMLQLDGSHVLTIEAVAQPDGSLHEVQRAMCENHGSQCGFCTPGFVMAMLGHFEHHPHRPADRKEIANHLTGNLCRCTGYLPILDAAADVRPERLQSVVARLHTEPLQRALTESTERPLSIAVEGRGRLDAPTTLDALLSLRAAHPDARITAGNTDLGVMINKQKLWPAGSSRHAITTHKVAELDHVTVHEGVVTVGAAATLGALERACETSVPELAKLLRVFASPQIKATATLMGNVANGSPIGDTLPALFALGAEVEAQSLRGARWIPIDALYVGYRALSIAPDEVLTRVRFSVPGDVAVFRAYKVCQRKDLDISFVGASFYLERSAGVVTRARVAYGGVGPTVMRLPAIEARLQGTAISDTQAWDAIADELAASLSPRSDLRGSLEARKILSANLLRKFANELRAEVSA